jgi:ribonuclease H2 subunit B
MTAATLAASMPPSNSNKDKAAAAAAKRKATTGSRGVEALKKVNTSSMAKMTSFFKPKGK